MQTNERKLTRNELWMGKYHAMKKYLEVHHQLPDKKKPYNHDLINWWKYNKKRVKEVSRRQKEWPCSASSTICVL